MKVISYAYKMFNQDVNDNISSEKISKIARETVGTIESLNGVKSPDFIIYSCTCRNRDSLPYSERFSLPYKRSFVEYL